MRRIGFGYIMAVIAAALLAACSPPLTPAPAAGPTLTAAPSPAATPVTAVPASGPTPSPEPLPPGAVGEIICGSADVGQVRFSPDEHYLAAYSYTDTYICDADTVAVQTTHHTDGGIVSQKWSPDSTRLAIGTNDGMLDVWNALTGKTQIYLKAGGEFVADLDWSPDGKQIVTTEGTGTIRVWDAATGQAVLTITDPNIFALVDWSPDGKWIAAGCPCGVSGVWDASTGRRASYLLGNPRGSVMALAWSPDSKQIAQVDIGVQVFDPATGRLLVATPEEPAQSYSMETLAWSPDGKWLAGGIIGGQGKSGISIWDAQTLRQMATANVTGAIVSLEWSPDGDFLISSDGTASRILLWRVSLLLPRKCC